MTAQDTELIDELNHYAAQGLRTLMFAKRELKEFDQESSPEEKYALVGITGVEDLLQDNVKKCITEFMDANIKVWMLTGDKGATAKNIGKTCGILEDAMDIFSIDIKKPISGELADIVTSIENKEKQQPSIFG